MGIISSIYNSGYNIKRLFLGEQELKLAYLGEQIVFNEVIDDLNYVLYEFYKGKTISNTIEAPVKRAILKGNTLVNLVNDVTSNEVGNYNNSPCKINVIRNLQNETLTIIFNVTSLEIPDGADGILRIGGGWSGQIRHNPTLGVNKVLYNYNQTSNSWLGVFSNSEAYNLGQRITISDVIVLEGDHTQEDIPYFEGMQSVKMPVLRTAGKNLFDVSKATNSYVNSSGEFKDNASNVRSDYIPIKPNTTYSFIAINSSQANSYFSWFTDDKTFISRHDKTQISTSPSNASFLIVHNQYGDKDLDSFKGMLTESDIIPEEYKSYKSNILTVNEDVTLRSNGDVYDELNLLTGRLTQRIDENNEVLSQEVVKTVDLTMVDQDEQTISKLNSFNGTTHVSTEVAENSIYPTIAIEVATE